VVFRNDLSHADCKRLYKQLETANSHTSSNQLCVVFCPSCSENQDRNNEDHSLIIYRYPIDIVHIESAEDNDLVTTFLKEQNNKFMNRSNIQVKYNSINNSSSILTEREHSIAQIIQNSIDNQVDDDITTHINNSNNTLQSYNDLIDEEVEFEVSQQKEEIKSEVVTQKLNPQLKSFSSRRQEHRTTTLELSSTDLDQQTQQQQSKTEMNQVPVTLIGMLQKNGFLSPGDTA
jgi:hypothetical protein